MILRRHQVFLLISAQSIPDLSGESMENVLRACCKESKLAKPHHGEVNDGREIGDICVKDYIAVKAAKHAATYVPHTSGRYSIKRFRKAQCPIVESLANSLLMHGRNNCKNLMAACIVKHTMEIINMLTDLNPIQVIVDVVINRRRRRYNNSGRSCSCCCSLRDCGP